MAGDLFLALSPCLGEGSHILKAQRCWEVKLYMHKDCFNAEH